MSMHEIEDLIEDSVSLLNNSKKSQQEKRELFYNLYRFQQMFDTGYTHFRVKDILLQNQFLFSIPLAKHPSFIKQTKKLKEIEKKLEDQRSTWIEDALCECDKESGEIMLYFDYASKLWQQLVTTKSLVDVEDLPEQLTIPELAKTVMQEASKQKDKQLILQWYAIVTNCFAEEYVDQDVYTSFTAFINDSANIEIKALALKSGIRNYDEDYGYLTIQTWEDERDFIDKNNLEKLFIVRFWLDLEVENDAIGAEYKAEKTAQTELNTGDKKQKKIALIPQELNTFLNQENGWIETAKIETDDEISWLWFKDENGSKDNVNDDYYRKLIRVTFNKNESGLQCDVGLQFGKILRWQKYKPASEPAFWHYYSNLLVDFDFEAAENKPFTDSWGFWKFRLSASDKKLKESLSVLFTYLQKQGEEILSVALSEFKQKLFKRDCDELTYLIENGEDGTGGVIPNYVIFDLAAIIPLLFIFNRIDQIKDTEKIQSDEEVKRYFAKFTQAFDELHTEGASRKYLEPYKDLNKLIKEGLPYMVHVHFIRYYREVLE